MEIIIAELLWMAKTYSVMRFCILVTASGATFMAPVSEDTTLGGSSKQDRSKSSNLPKPLDKSATILSVPRETLLDYRPSTLGFYSADLSIMAPAVTLAIMRTTTYKYLEARPKSRYRQLFIKDRRIMADNIYRAHINKEEPRTPEQLAADYNVPVEAVLEAIEYGQSNPPEVVADFAREEAIMAASGMLEPDYKYCGKPRTLSPEEWNDLLS